MSTNTRTSRTPLADTHRSSLLRLYLGRGILAVAWAAAFSANHDSLDAAAITLLVVYPLIDAVSSFIDFRALADGSQRRLTLFNGVLSTLVALGLGAAGANGAQAVLHVFGAWAVVSGVAQILVGLRRRSPELGKQWPMLLAGGLSILAGIGHNSQALADQPKLGILVLYTTAGGVFFILQAGLLARRARQVRTRTA
ncbi:DUF308 domain-containing protein [Streptomyces sp. NPDC050743]|uniref:DUF308 domain-containing protein n=1 Tax=Streptomyces sp. NPDC050743 TaxID=3365634 RepID=UPI0037AB171A